MINTSNIQQAKEQIKSSQKPAIVKSQNPEFDRKLLEHGKFQILLDVHDNKERTRLKQIKSGLNHVLAKIAAKNDVSIGIDLNTFRSLDKKQKALALEKIIQNIKICRKANCSLTLLNIKDKTDAANFLISLGASTKQASQATTF